MPRLAKNEVPLLSERPSAPDQPEKAPAAELRLVPPPQETNPSEESRQEKREALYSIARIEGMRVMASLAKAKHTAGTWDTSSDTETLTQLRDTELYLDDLLEKLRERGYHEGNVVMNDVLKRVTKGIKEVKDTIAIFSKDATDSNAIQEDGWDIPTVVDENDFVDIGRAEIVKDEDANELEWKHTHEVQDADLLPSDGRMLIADEEQEKQRVTAKKDLKSITNEELEKAVDEAFEPYTGDKAIAEAFQEPITDLEIELAFRGKEHSLLAIPADIASTRSKYVDLNKKAANITPETISKLGEDAVYSYLIDLSKSHAELEERLDILNAKKTSTDDDTEEKALIADALHLIEDMRHEIHQTINKKHETKFESIPAYEHFYGEEGETWNPSHRIRKQQQAITSTTWTNKKPEILSPFDQQMELKAELKKALEKCEIDLKILVEKAKPGQMAEMFLPQYTSRGVIGLLSRAFQPKPKIDAKEFQAIIGRMKNAQMKFNDAYYTLSEKAENIIGGYKPKDGMSVEDKMANLRMKRKGKRSMGGFMPVESLTKESDLIDTWRSLTKEIATLDEDLSTPITMTDSHRGEIKVSTREHAEAEEMRIESLRQKEAEIKETSARGVQDARDILKEIRDNPQAGELKQRATEYLSDLSTLILATASGNEQLIAPSLGRFKELHEALLEKGIAIKQGQGAIHDAEETLGSIEDKRVLPKQTPKNRTVRAITSSRKAKAKKKPTPPSDSGSDSDDEEIAA